MKNFNALILCLLSFVLITSTACNNDDDDGVSIGGDCTASWKVDGTDYSEELAACVYLDNTLNLTTNTTGGNFQLQIDPITTSGTYTADPNNQDLFVGIFITLDDGTRIGSSNATVNVTEISSSKAKGTFSGDFFDISDLTFNPVYSVTNGSFDASF